MNFADKYSRNYDDNQDNYNRYNQRNSSVDFNFSRTFVNNQAQTNRNVSFGNAASRNEPKPAFSFAKAAQMVHSTGNTNANQPFGQQTPAFNFRNAFESVSHHADADMDSDQIPAHQMYQIHQTHQMHQTHQTHQTSSTNPQTLHFGFHSSSQNNFQSPFPSAPQQIHSQISTQVYDHKFISQPSSHSILSQPQFKFGYTPTKDLHQDKERMKSQIESNVYSDMKELSENELSQFKADKFTFQMIPLKPPPQHFCV